MKVVAFALALAFAWLTGCRKDNGAARADRQPAVSMQTNVVRTRTMYLAHAQTNLATMKLFIGSQELLTELALKPTEIFTGMMWRTNIAETDSMLFAFPTAEPRSFYMRNTYVPLSVAYIDPEGVIQEIHDLQPLDETPVPSKSDNIQYVLEVKQGWFKRHNIAAGALVRCQYGDLKNTFTTVR